MKLKIKVYFVYKYLKCLYVVLTIFFSNVCSAENSKVTEMQAVKTLPVLKIGVGWTTKKARESSEILAELPSSFDEWQNAYLNTPVKFVLTDGDFELVVKETFTIAPNDKLVKGVSIALAPLFIDDLDGALDEVKWWLEYFSNSHLTEGVDSKHYDPKLSFKKATDKLNSSYAQKAEIFGSTFGVWQSDIAFYSVGIELTRYGDDFYQTSKTIYKVTINSWLKQFD